MNFVFVLLQILFLVTVTTKILTVAELTRICDKRIDSGPVGNTGLIGEPMETGRYKVKTFARTNSDEVRSLIAKLNGASDVQYTVASFTAILQPKDLKKVINY